MEGKVYLVVKTTDQNEYTEPKYYAAAQDTTEILACFADKKVADAYTKECFIAYEDEFTSYDIPAPMVSVMEFPILADKESAPEPGSM